MTSCAASTPRPPRCSARASSACGRRCSARRPRRSARPARCATTTSSSPATASTRVAYCRGVEPADLLRVWRGTAASGWNPYEHGMAAPQIIIGAQALHATGYAMGCGLGRRRRRSHRLLRRRRHERGRRERGARLRRELRRAGRLLLPEQPVGDLRAGRPAVQAAARATAPTASASPASASTATTCSPCSRRPASRSTARAAASGPTFIEAVTYRMGPHTTADDPTRYRDRRRARRLARARPDRARARPARGVGGRLRRSRARGRRRRRPRGRRAARRASRARRPRAADGLRQRLRRAEHPRSTRQRDHYARYLAMFDEPGAAASDRTEGGAR